MKLLVALLVSLGLEAYTYHESTNFMSNNISFILGINNPQSTTITIAAIALVKLIVICCLTDINRSKSNILILLLAICALCDCLLITLFLNSGMYAILFNISEFFGVVYRGVEVVCIVSLIFDASCILFHRPAVSSSSCNRDSSSGNIRMGDKI